MKTQQNKQQQIKKQLQQSQQKFSSNNNCEFKKQEPQQEQLLDHLENIQNNKKSLKTLNSKLIPDPLDNSNIQQSYTKNKNNEITKMAQSNSIQNQNFLGGLVNLNKKQKMSINNENLFNALEKSNFNERNSSLLLSESNSDPTIFHLLKQNESKTDSNLLDQSQINKLFTSKKIIEHKYAQQQKNERNQKKNYQDIQQFQNDLINTRKKLPSFEQSKVNIYDESIFKKIDYTNESQKSQNRFKKNINQYQLSVKLIRQRRIIFKTLRIRVKKALQYIDINNQNAVKSEIEKMKKFLQKYTDLNLQQQVNFPNDQYSFSKQTPFKDQNMVQVLKNELQLKNKQIQALYQKLKRQKENESKLISQLNDLKILSGQKDKKIKQLLDQINKMKQINKQMKNSISSLETQNNNYKKSLEECLEFKNFLIKILAKHHLLFPKSINKNNKQFKISLFQNDLENIQTTLNQLKNINQEYKNNIQKKQQPQQYPKHQSLIILSDKHKEISNPRNSSNSKNDTIESQIIKSDKKINNRRYGMSQLLLTQAKKIEEMIQIKKDNIM